MKAGDTLRNEKLATTLQTIADQGESSFYSSSSQLDHDIVSDIQQAGGIINITDLEQYHVKIYLLPSPPSTTVTRFTEHNLKSPLVPVYCLF